MSGLLGQLSQLADWLLESGYLWPLLGFIFACLLLARCRQSPPQAYGTRGGAAYDYRDASQAAASQRKGAVEYQAPPGYALVPMETAYGFHQPNQSGQLAPIWEEEGSQSGETPQGEREELQAQDFKALLDRTQQDEALSEGIARLRQSFLGPRDANEMARPGLMTARKVLELERVLIQELEDSYSQKVGFVASCFHRWRCEAACLRVGRRFEEDFGTQKGEWQRYLDSHEKTFEQKLLDAARKANEQQERSRRVAALLLEKWARGDDVGLARAAFGAWRDWAARLHTMRLQKRQVSTVVQLWLQGGVKALVHICLKSWRDFARDVREEQERERELLSAKKSWDAFFDQEHAKLKKKHGELMKDLDDRRERAERDVEIALSAWQKGQASGWASLVLQTWGQHARKARRLGRQKQAVHQVVLEACGGQECGLLKGCIAVWRRLSVHEQVLAAEKKKWESLLSGEQATWEREDASWEKSEARRAKAAHQLVDLSLRKWEKGESLGLLLKVFGTWVKEARSQGASRRQCEAVHASTMRWLGGSSLGEIRTCLLHWRALAERRRTSARHNAELEEKKSQFEALLADEGRKHEESVKDMEASTERDVKKAKAIVGLTVARWELGEGAGLVLEIFGAWRALMREAKRLARQRQAVHAAVLQALAGREQGALQSVLLNWRTWARQLREQQFGEKRLKEERRRWEEFLENEERSHAEGLKRVEGEAKETWRHAEEALGALLAKWHHGEASSLVFLSFMGWRQLSVSSATLNAGRQTVHVAVLRFFDGDVRGAARALLLNWRHWARLEVLHKTEVAERKRAIAQLEERSERLVSGRKSRLLKYAGILGSSSDPAFMTALLAGWRLHSAGVRSAEARRQLEVALQEQQRLHDIAVTRRRQLSVAALHLLGAKDDCTLALDCLLAWSKHRQESKQAWAHELARSELIKKYSWYVQCMANKEADESLLAACFWELLREARQQRHHREHEERVAQHTRLRTELETVEGERQDIEEQLAMAYKQIDSVTETLQKELRTKEDLATELREAYDKLRVQGTRRPRPTLPAPRSISENLEELPHLPGSVAGVPGGRDIDLGRSLVGRQDSAEEKESSGGRSTGTTPKGAGSNWSNAAERLFRPVFFSIKDDDDDDDTGIYNDDDVYDDDDSDDFIFP